MIRIRKTGWSRLWGPLEQAGAVGLVCLAAVAGEGTPVREKIQFSGTGDSPALPSRKPKDDLESKSPEFLGRGSSVSGAVPTTPTSVPSYQRNSRLQELFEMQLDQKRNWIFGQPEDFNHSPTAEDVYGAGAFGEVEAKPKTALERFLAGSGSKPGRGHADKSRRDGEKPDLDKSNSRLDHEDRHREEVPSPSANPYESARIMSAGFSFPNDFFGISTAPGHQNDFVSTAPSDPVAKTREDRKHADEFRKILNFSGSLTTGIEPLPLGLAPAHQEMNLVPAPRLGELPGTGIGGANPLRAINSPPASRINGLEDPSAKILGPSSLAPAVSAPNASPVRQTAPPVLEFPKRNF